MSTKRRTWLVLGLIGVIGAVFCAYRLYPAAAIDSAIRNGPLTIFASVNGGFTREAPWELQVVPSGNATLKINSYPMPKTRRFVVPEAQLDELRKALLREHFFDLADSYGEPVRDSSTSTLQVWAGDFSKTIELQFLMNWIQTEPARLREPSRALLVLQIIRAWFNDPEVVDSRKYDQMVIEAAGRK